MELKRSITVGIPAYNRPETLNRALQSLEKQIFKNFKVIVLDDNSPENDLSCITEKFKDKLDIIYIKNEKNKGLIKNNLELIKYVETEYFMWMADDDEYSDTYLMSLFKLIESDKTLSTAAGNWTLKNDESSAVIMKPAYFKDGSKTIRVIKYMYGSDDAFFYGLHRYSLIKDLFYRDYFWPNKGDVENWCYIPLFQMILKGRVEVTNDKTAIFINHQYTSKHYSRIGSGTFLILTKWAFRRLNIYMIYIEILFKNKEFYILPLAIIFGFLFFIRDVFLRISKAILNRVLLNKNEL
jgi:glycosyltransferase involved in cell wall biosynthesis